MKIYGDDEIALDVKILNEKRGMLNVFIEKYGVECNIPKYILKKTDDLFVGNKKEVKIPKWYLRRHKIIGWNQ